MRRDQPKTPEPMRGTLPNTDQPRIPHSEYRHNMASSARIASTLLVGTRRSRAQRCHWKRVRPGTNAGPSLGCIYCNEAFLPHHYEVWGNQWSHFRLFRIAASSIPFPIPDVSLTSFDCHVMCFYDFSGWPNVMNCSP